MKLSDLAITIISIMICSAIILFGMYVGGFAELSGRTFMGVFTILVGSGLMIFLCSGNKSEPQVYFIAQDGITIEEVVEEKLNQMEGNEE